MCDWIANVHCKTFLMHCTDYRILSSIMHIQIQCSPEFHNDFWQKKLFLFFKNNFTRFNHCKFIHNKSHLKPFLNYLPSIMCREYFSIIFNVRKCTLYSIKYSSYIWQRGQVRPASLSMNCELFFTTMTPFLGFYLHLFSFIWETF